jgi:hypothetical protein
MAAEFCHHPGRVGYLRSVQMTAQRGYPDRPNPIEPAPSPNAGPRLAGPYVTPDHLDQQGDRSNLREFQFSLPCPQIL